MVSGIEMGNGAWALISSDYTRLVLAIIVSGKTCKVEVKEDQYQHGLPHTRRGTAASVCSISYITYLGSTRVF
jgi:hypothetical protein